MTKENQKGTKSIKNQIMIMNMNDANRLLVFLDREGKILQARKVETGFYSLSYLYLSLHVIFM